MPDLSLEQSKPTGHADPEFFRKNGHCRMYCHKCNKPDDVDAENRLP